jgi:hypothetical protein
MIHGSSAFSGGGECKSNANGPLSIYLLFKNAYQAVIGSQILNQETNFISLNQSNLNQRQVSY